MLLAIIFELPVQVSKPTEKRCPPLKEGTTKVWGPRWSASRILQTHWQGGILPMGASAFNPPSAPECHVLRLNPLHLSTVRWGGFTAQHLPVWDDGLPAGAERILSVPRRIAARASREAWADTLAWNAGCRLQEAQVRAGAQRLSPSVKIIKAEVTPFGSAEACSLHFCWWAARVRSRVSCLITFFSEDCWAERSGLLMLKAGFPVPSIAPPSSLTGAKEGGQKITLRQNIFQWQAANSSQ